MAKLITLLIFLAIQAGLSFRVQEAETDASELWERGQQPVHMARMAAFGSDLTEFIKNAEKNEQYALMARQGAKQVFSQQTFCPVPWRAQIGKQGKYVGGGAFGKVYVSELTCDSTTVAIKVQKKTPGTDKEANVMMSLAHPNVIKAFATASGPGRGQTSLMMEACSGGDLDGMLSLPGKEQARLFYETFLGVAYMHQQGLVHSDLKLENVMLSSKCTSTDGKTCHSKVADLGLTCSVRRNGDCNGIAGTPLYMSPDLIMTGRRSQPDDLWSLGVMLHSMVKGSEPSFLRKKFASVDMLLRSIKGLGESGYAYRAQGSSAKETLLAMLLVATPRSRISASAAAKWAERWMAEERAGDIEAAPLATMPACWAQCQRARCDWQKSSCTLDATNSAQCVAFEKPTAGEGQTEGGIVTVKIRRGHSGSLGFTAEATVGRVTKVTRYGQADMAGLRMGDVILQVNNMSWDNLGTFGRHRIMNQSPVVDLRIRRL